MDDSNSPSKKDARKAVRIPGENQPLMDDSNSPSKKDAKKAVRIPGENQPLMDDSNSPSKKGANKAARRDEKLIRRLSQSPASPASEDPFSTNYGDIQSVLEDGNLGGGQWISVADLTAELDNTKVILSGWVHRIRPRGKSCFIILRELYSTVQCYIHVDEQFVSRQFFKFASRLGLESVIEVHGTVSNTTNEVIGTTQKCEVRVERLYVISRPSISLPFNVADASINDAVLHDAKRPKINQETRLDYRVLDLRTPANLAIFDLQSAVVDISRTFLRSQGFRLIHTPKLLSGSCDSGAALFKFNYFDQPASLAQSGMLHKQLAIASGFKQVYEIGPYFRADNSNTHRHLCEFWVLNVEMQIQRSYTEIMDLVHSLFIELFDSINKDFRRELHAIHEQFPFQPLKYTKKPVILEFAKGIQMLKESGATVDDFADLTTESERKLGDLVLQKYETDFYILHKYPLAARPFFTMPCIEDARYSHSFDVFIRGEEIISGSQRIHELEKLKAQALHNNINLEEIKYYLDSLRYGVPMHGGFGAGIERVVMLFCNLKNIRKTSMFPRDPKRLRP